jgi:hypothetical protein
MLGYTSRGGLALLRDYGYDLELDEGTLKETVDVLCFRIFAALIHTSTRHGVSLQP